VVLPTSVPTTPGRTAATPTPTTLRFANTIWTTGPHRVYGLSHDVKPYEPEQLLDAVLR
jgi:hypothetical protein